MKVISLICPKGHQKNGIRRRKLVGGVIKEYPWCTICAREKKLKWEADHPQETKESARKTKLKIKYGITDDEYNALLKIQNGVCLICRQPPKDKPLHVDHKENTIRGLLCSQCNLALGLLKDNPDVMRRAIDYLDANNIVRLINRKETMKIIIEPTTKKVSLDGVEHRVWEGATESGIKVHAYITRIAVGIDEPSEVHAQFQNELQETKAPSAEIQAIPLSMIL